jgi:integrase
MGRKRRDVPWLEPRDNGVYYAHWYDPIGKQTRRESMDTRDNGAAVQRFADFLRDGPKASQHVGAAGVKVWQVLEWYDTGVPGAVPPIAGHVQVNVVDKMRQRAALTNLRAYFGEMLCKNVGIVETEAYARARRAGEIGVGKGGRWAGNGNKKGSDNTIRRELGALAAAAHWCSKRKLGDQRLLPLDQIPQIEKPKEPIGKAPWLTKDAVRTIFDKADGKLRAFCRLTYYWGARRESVETLFVSQVDLKHGRVDLHRPGRQRTKKRRPIVPIYPEIRRDVETLLLDTDNEYLFGSNRSFYTAFVKLCSDAGVVPVDAPEDRENVWPHLLRHSRATHMLMDGEDPYKVAKLLGDTLGTIERVYGHHTPEYLVTKSNVEVG